MNKKHFLQFKRAFIEANKTFLMDGESPSLTIFQKQSQEMFFKKVALKNFTKFTGKHVARVTF